MRIGIIGSAGGSAFAELYRIIQQVAPFYAQFFVVTDRACGLEDFCNLQGIPYLRIVESSNETFSQKAANYFQSVQVDMIVLYFSRLVTEHLYHKLPTFNIHPALLPAFKGLSAVKQFNRAKAKFLGATLHLVDESADGGPIIAQVSMPVAIGATEQMLNKYSFIQKVYLGLIAIELMSSKAIQLEANNADYLIVNDLPYTDRCNPSLRHHTLLQQVFALQEAEGVRVIS